MLIPANQNKAHKIRPPPGLQRVDLLASRRWFAVPPVTQRDS